MTEFSISAEWIPQEGRNEADATLSSLLIEVADQAVTEFVDRKGLASKVIQIPAYYLAEWIAENWWALLWEPRKNEEEGDDNAFLARHSFLTAQHGFALPKVSIVPLGKSVEITASSRTVELANVRFLNRAQVVCARERLEEELKKFVQSVVARLNEGRISDTWLHDTWALISETDADEAQFCRFAGALGLSPYDIDESVAAIIERLQPLLGDRSLMDLCLASSAEQFPAVAGVAEQALEIVRDAPPSTLSPIESIGPPREILSLPAHRRGTQAAHILRKRLGISDTDVRGATRIFDMLKIDTARQSSSSSAASDEAAVTGAVVRDNDVMRVGLLQQKETKRRFSGARAIFSAWTAEDLTESRLLTSAVTRDQQANRAFAAELTAPKALLQSRAKSGSLSQSAVFDLAAELQVSADVVAKQAHNNNIRVARI
ncbi:hypothetical protein G8O24_38105 [Bradyrhizobium sp. INPA01-394B]|uniref:ImmA/IrrE family metallo-endopeptidase n=1 Tax=Bradyrhizobium campsiandrae TaxID=1729892 RepID=A0ABR7U274_9BRAD|nr:hypothetical protein [Bradyrhizobium campsiandrae]MBC9883109.1 hypothetical protein [Bradyrhizobium campsiandrae]MBC9978071.1 hypothetical protein [Bradyrhizobium campsiandrae]